MCPGLPGIGEGDSAGCRGDPTYSRALEKWPWDGRVEEQGTSYQGLRPGKGVQQLEEGEDLK